MTDQKRSERPPVTRRSIYVLISAFALVAIAAVVIAMLLRPSGSAGRPSGGPSDTAATGSATSTAKPTASAAPPITVESPVPIASPAQPVSGVTVAVGGFESVEGEAQLPGDIGGPAIRFTVTVTNGTSQTISLAGALVNVYYGAEQSPADSLQKPGGVPLPGEVGAGQDVQAVYVYTVPIDERDDVLITFDYQVGVPVVAFQGAIPA